MTDHKASLWVLLPRPWAGTPPSYTKQLILQEETFWALVVYQTECRVSHFQAPRLRNKLPLHVAYAQPSSDGFEAFSKQLLHQHWKNTGSPFTVWTHFPLRLWLTQLTYRTHAAEESHPTQQQHKTSSPNTRSWINTSSFKSGQISMVSNLSCTRGQF